MGRDSASVQAYAPEAERPATPSSDFAEATKRASTAAKRPAKRPAMTPASPRKNGLPLALAAYTIWGFLPLYIALLKAVPAFELVAWRVMFTLPFGKRGTPGTG